MVEPVTSQADWIARSAEAARVLVVKYGYKPDQFHVCTASDEPSIDWHEAYPADFRDVLNGKPRPFVKPTACVGVTLFWPSGTNYYGEGYDPACALFELEHAEYINSVDFEALVMAVTP